jgi:hypothetical protein
MGGRDHKNGKIMKKLIEQTRNFIERTIPRHPQDCRRIVWIETAVILIAAIVFLVLVVCVPVKVLK